MPIAPSSPRTDQGKIPRKRHFMLNFILTTLKLNGRASHVKATRLDQYCFDVRIELIRIGLGRFLR